MTRHAEYICGAIQTADVDAGLLEIEETVAQLLQSPEGRQLLAPIGPGSSPAHLTEDDRQGVPSAQGPRHAAQDLVLRPFDIDLDKGRPRGDAGRIEGSDAHPDLLHVGSGTVRDERVPADVSVLGDQALHLAILIAQSEVENCGLVGCLLRERFPAQVRQMGHGLEQMDGSAKVDAPGQEQAEVADVRPDVEERAIPLDVRHNRCHQLLVLVPSALEPVQGLGVSDARRIVSPLETTDDALPYPPEQAHRRSPCPCPPRHPVGGRCRCPGGPVEACRWPRRVRASGIMPALRSHRERT